MSTTTTRMAIPHPDSADNPGLVTDLAALANQIDATAAMYAQGTFAARPAVGKVGRIYYATDTLQHFWDTGAAWVALGTVTPAGVIEMWAGSSSAPNGYLLCDGSAVSRTTYATLFAAIGTAYGSGDGSTTFNVPDYRGRSPVGVGTHADVNARNLNDGLAVGSRRPKHKHTVALNDPTHSHAYDYGGNVNLPGGALLEKNMDGTRAAGTAAIDPAATGITVTVGPQTGSEPTDTPAFNTCYFIIKT